MIVGLGHVARCGKDTAAEGLEGWQRIAFADTLREMALATNPYIASLVDSGGWDGAKLHRQVNRVMEDLGTIVRKRFGPDCLIDAAFRKMDGRDVVITDVRYPSEVHAIREAGGVLVRVDRPGVGPSRPSDRRLIGYEGWDRVITNSGSVDDLQRALRRAVRNLTAEQETAS